MSVTTERVSRVEPGHQNGLPIMGDFTTRAGQALHLFGWLSDRADKLLYDLKLPRLTITVSEAQLFVFVPQHETLRVNSPPGPQPVTGVIRDKQVGEFGIQCHFLTHSIDMVLDRMRMASASIV